MKDIQSFLFDVKNNSSVGGFMNSGIERRTTDTAFETGYLDAVENILTVEYFTHRTMREHDDYVVGYRYGRLSLDTPEPSEPEPQPAARRKTNIGRKSGNARNFPTEIPPESPQDDTERKELETLII